MSRPGLFSVLAQQLQSADILTSHRIFMVLFRTLKELSTKRLASDQRNFAEVYRLIHQLFVVVILIFVIPDKIYDLFVCFFF